ncbi:hypothetical protein TEA_006105 [Camellia sinensis var. sinensis]|uniref:Uncharacterized protein n=1 Tax=Camellia sinensis var. sinensis TaxID=542762 RepID=A0A4S4F0N4_CAMSN|nr:hypothetical protein TEA_006105 [Camellia sinensis var. sinensis]
MKHGYSKNSAVRVPDTYRVRVRIPCTAVHVPGTAKGGPVRLVHSGTPWVRRGYAYRVTPRKAEKKEVIMVDPLEAKRLAAKQMAEIKEKERLKRRREIEAINGAWAMIGLTAGLVIEGHTGNSILSQLAGYWAAIVHFFVR